MATAASTPVAAAVAATAPVTTTRAPTTTADIPTTTSTTRPGTTTTAVAATTTTPATTTTRPATTTTGPTRHDRGLDDYDGAGQHHIIDANDVSAEHNDHESGAGDDHHFAARSPHDDRGYAVPSQPLVHLTSPEELGATRSR